MKARLAADGLVQHADELGVPFFIVKKDDGIVEPLVELALDIVDGVACLVNFGIPGQHHEGGIFTRLRRGQKGVLALGREGAIEVLRRSGDIVGLRVVCDLDQVKREDGNRDLQDEV